MIEKKPSSHSKLAASLQAAIPEPAPQTVGRSRLRVQKWYSATAPVIVWERIEAPIGPVYLAKTASGLRRIGFGDQPADFFASLGGRARLRRDPQALSEVVHALRAYFRSGQLDLETRADLSGLTAFQRAVLQTIAAIPPGQVRTYREIAEASGRPRASRAVGQALARNPLPIFFPCHRVIASDGGLGGYAGGLERKAFLLRLEGARAA